MRTITKAVVILSGGQKSTTCLYWALKRYDVVEAITFDFGQNNDIEILQSKMICKKENIKHLTFKLPFNNAKILNQLCITMSHAYAIEAKALYLVSGLSKNENENFGQEFVHSLQIALNKTSNSNIGIDTPLMNIDRSQMFKLAVDLDCLREVLQYSHTCDNGDRVTQNDWGVGCRECPSCELRANGWFDFLTANNLQIEYLYR